MLFGIYLSGWAAVMLMGAMVLMAAAKWFRLRVSVGDLVTLDLM